MSTVSTSLGDGPAVISLIKESEQRGSVSRRLALRALVIYSIICILGALPLVLDFGPQWQVAGLGLWVPGGGFLANGGGWGIVGFAVTMLLFGIAYLLWFGIGTMYLMLLVWIAAAVVAALQAGTSVQPFAIYLVPAIPIAFLLYRRARAGRRIARELEIREELNAVLPQAIEALHQRAVPAQVGQRELSVDQLAALRFAYDRALQPVGDFNGFNVIDQYRESAIRYQLNNLGFALALAQCHYLPNFHGYLSQAQRNLLEKFLDRRVWSYWRVENLLGNLSLNADPIAKDNIMLGGFYNANLGFYAANTGDRRYMERGNLVFRLNGKKAFAHDMSTVAAVSRRNFADSPFSLYPCEPTFSYSYCNLQGLTGIHLNDRVFGTRYADDIVPRFRRNFENEFMDADGSIIASRNNVTGLRFHAFDATWTRAAYCWLINGHFPDISERIWAILREQRIRFTTDGELDLDLTSWIDRIDIGNYRFTGAMNYVQLAVAASEHGDREVADAALRGLDQHHRRNVEGGVLRYNDMSTFANGLVVMGRLMQRHDWRNLVHRGPPAETFRGPLLTAGHYPDVQVASAYSNGEDLRLVLYPGGGQTRQTIDFERLRPNTSYRLQGSVNSHMNADGQGRASTTIEIPRRTEIHVVPGP